VIFVKNKMSNFSAI